MQTVLYSVTVARVLRCVEWTGGRPATCLDKYVRVRVVQFMIDPDCGIVDEWKRTAGDERVKMLVIHWTDLGGVRSVEALGTIPTDVGWRLRIMGFTDGPDRLVLKTAIGSPDRVVTGIVCGRCGRRRHRSGR